MQTDGNLMMYAGTSDNQGALLWTTGTAGKCGNISCYGQFQSDGNLVLYAYSQAPGATVATNSPYWSAGVTGPLTLHFTATAPFASILDGSGKAVWSAGALQPGQVLRRGASMTSPNRDYTLLMQGDGNLVVNHTADNAPVWAAYTQAPSATYALLQGDGNLVVNDDSNKTYWSSGTAGQPGAGAQLVLHNDGTPVITDASGTVYWPGPSTLQANQSLARKQALTSPNGAFMLLMQTDGNLVKYRKSDNLLLWSAGSRPPQPTRCSRAMAISSCSTIAISPTGAQEPPANQARANSWRSATTGRW
jgi:hypothetical protein